MLKPLERRWSVRNPASNLLCRALLALSALAFWPAAFAVQYPDGADLERKEAIISMREPNRLAVEGGRIRDVRNVKGEIEKVVDEHVGQVFLTLPADTDKKINIFVTDDNDATYSLMLIPQDVPAETIILRPSGRTRNATSGGEKAPSYQRAVKNLILTMSDTTARRDGKEINKVVPLWKDTRMILNRRFNQGGLIGERYFLVNLSAIEMVLAEQEFYRPGVLAVSVEHHNLAPAQSTTVLVVRQRGDND